jgi:hypothetical protein
VSAKLSIRDWGIIAALALVVVLFWRLRLIAPATQLQFASGDFFTQHYPMADLAAEWMRAGSIPLWNPFQFCGQPFLATLLYGVFYPLHFFQLLLPIPLALEATVVLHLFAAGVFMYLYARVIQLGRPAAVTAGVVFMFSGFLVEQALVSPPAFPASAWVPVAFLAVEKIFAQRRFGWAILFAIAVAMPLLAGYAQSWTYLLYAVAAFAGVRLVLLITRRADRACVPRIAMLLCAGVLLGVALAAIQVLPTLELQRLGSRHGPLSVADMLPFGPLPPARLLADAVNSSPGFPRWTYIGIVPLVLIPASLLAAGERVRLLFLWGLGLWSTAVTVSVFTPVFALYLWLPTLSWFRGPEHMLLLYCFAGAALTGIGFDALTGAGSRTGVRLWAVAAAIALGLVWAVGALPERSRIYLALGVPLLWGAALFRKRLLAEVASAGAIGLILVDLFFAVSNPALHPYHDLRPVNAEHEVFDMIKEMQGLYRTYIFPTGFFYTMAKQGTLHRIYSITDYEPLSLMRYKKFFALLDDPASRPVWQFDGYLKLAPSPERLRLLDLMSVRYIVAPKLALDFRQPLEGDNWTPTNASTAGTLMVYENRMALPRAYVAFAANIVGGEDDALRALTDPAFNRRRTVVIEQQPGDPALGFAHGNPPPAILSARITSYRPTRVALEADIDKPGWLVLTDTYYPGWTASVDGRRQKIYCANYLFRGVPLSAGHHRVVFTYDPLSFRIGAGVTLAALSVVVIYFGRATERRVRRAGGGSSIGEPA